MILSVFRIFAWLACACLLVPAWAQTAAPSAEQMIEQLKAPRTRSLRNLSVEAVSAQTDAASAGTPGRPSLSLLIQFDFNSARVRPESQQALANLSQALQSAELGASRFAVEGHTDAKGSVDYNLKLSQQRAQAVRDFLKTQGVNEARLVATGKGSAELANAAEPFAAENRRVRIVNLD
ncbi:OmpA family protein [Rhodoferax sp.]|uniref:OmpA family protein n=1 Tax=Rhodoferax sp. TaxID=50421 RepID=UPI0025D68D2E|nr:OmpA family protein [Rhodoferax sp.]